MRSSPWSSSSSNTSAWYGTRGGIGLRAGLSSGSSGVSDLAQMDFFTVPSANDADRGTGAVRSNAGAVCEKEDEKPAGAAVMGGLRAE
jgi:hypothetical protein